MSLQLLSFLALLIITCAITILHKLVRSQKHAKQTTLPLPLPPGPTGWPVIGCLPEMIKNKPTFRWIHKVMQENNTEIACIRLGKTYIIPIASPELVCEVLRKQDETFASRPEYMSAKLASDDFLTAVLSPVGDQWMKMRRIVSSVMLSPAMLRFLHLKRCQEADHLVRYVYNQCCPIRNQGPVNVRVAAQHYCSNVMRKLVFGKRFFGVGMADGGPGEEEEEHMTGLFTILQFVFGFGIADFFPWLEVFDFDGYKRIISNAINSVRKYQDPEILRRVEMWRGKGNNNNNNNNKEKEEDILDVLINLKDSKNNPMLSIQEIGAQITEIMTASLDNPSNAVEWAIAEMINQPHILDKAHEELDRVVGKEKFVQESDLPKLNYIRSCVKESFRLHPVALLNAPHVSTKDTTIAGKYFIPKGSHILVNRTGLGRNPRVWEDPLEYKPERHIVDGEREVGLVDHEMRMFSFGTGRRGCPGLVLGTTMATMLLARLIQGFSWAAPLDGPSCGIKLAESENNLLMAKPLIALATPRLEHKIYKQLFASE